MKTKLITIIFALCMLFGTTAIAAEYTVADILDFDAEKISAVDSLYVLKGEYSDKVGGYLIDSNEITEFVQKLSEMNVKAFDEPVAEDKERKTVSFATEELSYTYSNYEGFTIYDNNNKWYHMRYLISEENLDKLINELPLQWKDADGMLDIVAEFTIGKNLFYFHGEERKVDENSAVVPYIDMETSRTMVPLRALAEALDYDVEWNEADRSIILKYYPEFHVTMKIASNEVILEQYDSEKYYFSDNKAEALIWEKQLDTECSPCIVNDRTFIPLRTVAEIFGFHVEWNEETQEIYIREESNKQFYPFPFIELSDEVNLCGFDCYNKAYAPMSLFFNDVWQVKGYIYDENGNELLKTDHYWNLCETSELSVYYNKPNRVADTIGNYGDKLEKGSYYADVYFEGYDMDAYRVFFEVE